MSWSQIGSDINGETAGELAGFSVALSSDGTVVAIGAPFNDVGGTNIGRVRVYKNNNNIWTKIGSDIVGEAADDYSGFSLSISDDGGVLAIGLPYNDGGGSNAGTTRVYKNISNTWTLISTDTTFDGGQAGGQQGYSVAISGNGLVVARGGIYSDNGSTTNTGSVRVLSYSSGTTWNTIGSVIFGEAANDQSGWSLAMNYDGTVLAIGAPYNDGGGSNSGSVRVYKNVSGTWTKINTDTTFDGTGSGDQAGYSVALNSDGTILAIGSNLANPSANGTIDSGTVRVFSYSSGTTWNKIGANILGTINYDQFGYSLRLSSDGSIVAVGSPFNDDNGIESGTVSLYKNNNNTWTKLNPSIYGEAAGDNFGYFLGLSSDGSIVAVGSPYNDGNGTDSGNVKVLKYIPTPNAPTISSVTVSQTTATINFTQSPSDSTITSYKYASSTNGTTYSAYTTSNWTSGTSFTVSGLTVGTTYYFKVIANNGSDSAESTASSATTISNFAPNAPTISSVTVSQTTATINFTAGSANGSNAVTSYKYASSTNGTTYSSYIASNWTSGTSFTVSGLSVGTTYYFRIISNNGIDSAASTASSATTVSNFAPNAPTISSVTVSQNTATINFTAGSANGSNPVTSYKYASSTNGTTYSSYIESNWTSGTSFTVSGLSVETTYYFRIIANNGIDSAASTASSATTVSNFAPNAPTISSVTVLETTATINFSQVSNGSNPITSYKYASSTNGTTYSSYIASNWTSGTSFTVSGLTVGTTYYFRIIANNGIDSAASTASSATTVSNFAPNAPTISSVTSSQTTATINFTAGSSNGSNAVTSYKYASSTNGTTYSAYTTSNWSSGTSFTVTGLTAGTTYYFKIIANNGIDSPASNASSGITIINIAPNAPTNLSATVSQATATINFTAGSSNSSDAITSYKYATSSDGTTYSSFTSINLTLVSSTQVTISGLTVGNTYYFKLIANNGTDSVASSASNSITVLNFAPNAPIISSVTVLETTATINFSQVSNGSNAVTSYKYASSTNGTTYSSYIASNWSSGTSFTVTGLTIGTTYYFKIIANNGIDSAASSASSATTVSNFAPNAPTISSVTVSQNIATINFIAGSSNGSNAVTSYKYASSTDGTTYSAYTTSNWTSGTSFTVSGLTVGITYYFRIIANNGIDSTASSASSGTMVSNYAPNIPTISSVTMSQNIATINFTAGSSNGSNAVTSYKYASSTNGTTYSSYIASNWSSGTSFTVTGLTVGTTYYFRIIANNGIDSAASSASSGITVSNYAPNTPTISSVTVSQTTATINFTAGSTNGSNAVTSYKYASSTNGTTYSGYTTSNWSSGTSFTVPGLTVGTTYYFKIIANNGIDSAESSASTATTVSNYAPNAPTSLSVTVSGRTATINFTAVSSNGSNAVTSYKYATSSDGTNYSSFTSTNLTIVSSTQVSISGLSAGSFYFKLIANNGIDSSPSSASNLASISNFAPSAPSNLTASVSSTDILISFTQAQNGSLSITSYTYSYSIDGGITYSSFTNTGLTIMSSSQVKISGLENSAYYFKLIAYNGISSSESSISNRIILGNFAPSAPTNLIATNSETTVTISFTQPENGSQSVTSYSYAYSIDGINYTTFRNTNLSWTTGSTTLTISNLPLKQTYNFRLRSNNGFNSLSSEPSNSLLLNIAPLAPTNLVATLLNDKVIIDFTQSLNGSIDVSNYTYSYSTNGTTYSSFTNSGLTQLSSTKLSISGLTNGTTYYFKIKGNNGLDSPTSDSSNSLVFLFSASPPSNLVATISGTTATIDFVQSDNDISSVSSYAYSYSTDSTYYSALSTINLIKVSSSKVTISGLTNRSTYSFKLFSYNGFKYSEASTVSNSILVENDIIDSIVQIGSPIYGAVPGDQFGTVVSISDDGTVMAVGAPYSKSYKGSIRVYKKTNNVWSQIGSDIVGNSTLTGLLSLSGDGTTVAIGERNFFSWNYSTSQYIDGKVYVFKNINNIWTKIGLDIIPPVLPLSIKGLFGFSGSLSFNGTVLVIGEPSNRGSNIQLPKIDCGSVSIYNNINNVWTKITQIYGENAGDKFGSSVSLSSDGLRLAVGAPYSNKNGTSSGAVYIYVNVNGVWTLRLNHAGDAGTNFGFSLSLIGTNDQNTHWAVGSPAIDSTTNSGNVSVFRLVMQQRAGKIVPTVYRTGTKLLGITNGEMFGYSVSLHNQSTNLNLVVSSIKAIKNNSTVGVIKTFNIVTPGLTPFYDQVPWVSAGNDIISVSNNLFGNSVSTNSDGSIIAVGAPLEDGGGIDAGSVTTFEYYVNPLPPVNLIATASDTTVTINFTQPQKYLARNVSSYKYSYSIDNGNTYSFYSSTNISLISSSSVTISGLSRGLNYKFKLISNNGINSIESDSSNSVGIFNYVSPAPTNLSASIISASPFLYNLSGSNQIQVVRITFTQETNGSNPGITKYLYSISSDGTNYSSLSDQNIFWQNGANYVDIIFLPVGTIYIKLVSNNTQNSLLSTASNQINIPNYPRAAPVITSSTVSGQTVTINFTQSTNNSLPITGYKCNAYQYISASSFTNLGLIQDQNISWTQGANNLNIYGLNHATRYFFVLYAFNGLNSDSSNISSTISFSITTQPLAPYITSVSNAGQIATINFTQPTNGTASVTSYTYSYSTNEGQTWTAFTNTNLTRATGNTSVTISGLQLGSTYYFRLRSNNGVSSDISGSSKGLFMNIPPLAPSITGFSISAQTVRINFTQGTNGSAAIQNYTYAFSRDGGSTYSTFRPNNLTWTSGLSYLSISNLFPGNYYFKIISNNGFDSPQSNASGLVTISNFAPDAPSITSAGISGQTASISFNQSANGSSDVISYSYVYSTDGINYSSSPINTNLSWSSGTRILTISGLTNGTTYNFKLIANNGINSLASNASNSVFVNFAPSAPTELSAVGENTTAKIYFTQQTNGSLGITNYAYSIDNVNFNLLSPQANGQNQITSPITIYGLLNRQTYSITLKSFNGFYSNASTTITNVFINTPAPSPAIISASGSNTTITVNFTPATDTSSPITNYAYCLDNTITGNSIFTLLPTPKITSPITITGLTNGQKYSVTIKSFNGLYSSSSATIPNVLVNYSPESPVITTITAKAGIAIINFTQQVNSSKNITGYYYTTETTITNNTVFNPVPLNNGRQQLSSPIIISNLTNETTYSFTLKSYNDLFSNNSNTVSVTIPAGPLPPVINSITSNGLGVATIKISQPTNNSRPLENYAYNIDGTNWILFDPPTLETTLYIDVYDNTKLYNFKLRSFNGESYSTDSNTISNVPMFFSPPPAPVINSINAMSGTITVRYSQSLTGVTTPIINYAYCTDSIIRRSSIFNLLDPPNTSGVLTITGVSFYGNITIRAFNGAYSAISNSVSYVMSSVNSSTNDIVRIRQTNSSSPIQYSINNGSSWSTVVWPFIIGNINSTTKVLTVNIETPLFLSTLPNDVTNFFIIVNDKITINGNDNSITINNFPNFSGLIQNGTSNNYGFNNITIQRIAISTSGNTTLANGQGWICQSYFGNTSSNNLIQTCSSNGTISSNSGGICGQYTAINSTNFNIQTCTSSGNIMNDLNGKDAGGIIGRNSGSGSSLFIINNCIYSGAINGYGSGGIIGASCSNIKITNCSSSGIIKSGGIAGTSTGVTTNINSGLVEIIDCYSSGIIGSTGSTINLRTNTKLASFAGGIVADYASNVRITRCYSFGQIGIQYDTGQKTISGDTIMAVNSAGGIIGSYAGSNNGSVYIEFCASFGNINENCGGIAAESFGVYSGRKHIIKFCYSMGNIGNNAGGICGPNIAPGYDTFPYYNYTQYYAESYSNFLAGITNTNSLFYINGKLVFENLGWGYSSVNSQREAFIDILLCCSYGSVSSSSSGGIIARSTINYPRALENNSYVCYAWVTHLFGCKYYGTPITGTVFRNGIYPPYIDLYSSLGNESGINLNNSFIGIDSTIPPNQGVYRERIDYGNYFGNEIPNSIKATVNNNNSAYETYVNIDLFLIKKRLTYGLYLPITLFPTKLLPISKLLNLCYSVPEIIQNGYVLSEFATVPIPISMYSNSFFGNYTIITLVNGGYPLSGLKQNGATLSQIHAANLSGNLGFTAQIYFNTGFDLQTIKTALNYSIQQFTNDNFTPKQIASIFTIVELANFGWNSRNFRIAEQNAITVGRTLGYNYLQYEGSGYKITDLVPPSNTIYDDYNSPAWKNYIEIGYSPRLLLPSQDDWPNMDAYNLPSNFTPFDIAKTKITPSDCLNAGYSRRDVARRDLFGFSIKTLLQYGYEVPELVTVREPDSWNNPNRNLDRLSFEEAGVTSTDINNSPKYYRQPPPIITDIVTTNDNIYIYFVQELYVPNPIEGYYYSFDGDIFEYVENKGKSPLVIPNIKEGQYDTFIITPYNGYLGPSNKIFKKVPRPVDGLTTIELLFRNWIGLKWPMVEPPSISNEAENLKFIAKSGTKLIRNIRNSVSTISNSDSTISNSISTISNSGSTISNSGSTISNSISTISNSVATINIPGTVKIANDVINFITSLFYKNVDEDVKNMEIRVNTSYLGTPVQSSISWFSTWSVQGMITELAKISIMLVQLSVAQMGAQKLVPTSLTINKLDNSPTITNVVCENGTITVHFTIVPESGITLDNYAYSINGTDFILMKPKTTTSPLIIKNSGVAPGEQHTICIRACDYRTTLYNGYYSNSILPFDDTFTYPIQTRAYSSSSNSVTFTANFGNMAPELTNMIRSTTDTKTASVSFTQSKVNAGRQIINYAWSGDNGKTFNLLNPPQINSPLNITGILSTTTQITLKSFNGSYSRYSSNYISVNPSNKPPTPTIETDGVFKTRNSQYDIIPGAFTVTFQSGKIGSNTPILRYEYTIDNGTTFVPITARTIARAYDTATQIKLTLATTVTSIRIAVRTYNGYYSTLSNYVNSA